MKRFLVCLSACLLLTPSAAGAARTPLDTISRDPYVSALVIDAASGATLFEENADARVYPASVLKLMVLLVVLDRIEQGLLHLEDMVPVSIQAYKTGGSQVYLDPREQFSVEEMLYALMVQSANDAAVALADHIAGSRDEFVILMNQKASELGMRNTLFQSVHGLPPSEGREPDVTTARDLAILCLALVKRPEVLTYTATRTRGFREETFVMHNHNKLLGQVQGCDGLKTGYFQAAGFSIATTASKNGVRIIALVMGSKERKVRDAKAVELLHKGFALAPAPLKIPETAASSLPGEEGMPLPSPAVTEAEPVQVAAPGGAPVTATTEVTAAASPTPSPASTPSATSSGWSTFFIGLGLGFLLFLGLFVAAGFLMNKRGKSRQKNLRRL